MIQGWHNRQWTMREWRIHPVLLSLIYKVIIQRYSYLTKHHLHPIRVQFSCRDRTTCKRKKRNLHKADVKHFVNYVPIWLAWFTTGVRAQTSCLPHSSHTATHHSTCNSHRNRWRMTTMTKFTVQVTWFRHKVHKHPIDIIDFTNEIDTSTERCCRSHNKVTPISYQHRLQLLGNNDAQWQTQHLHVNLL